MEERKKNRGNEGKSDSERKNRESEINSENTMVKYDILKKEMRFKIQQ